MDNNKAKLFLTKYLKNYNPEDAQIKLKISHIYRVAELSKRLAAMLNLSEEDSAEVEVSIDVSSNGLKRTGRRTLRELKYYYVENKFFINIILGTLILILVMVFPFNKYVVNRNLKEGEVLGTSAFNIKVTDSYLTDRKRISKDNSYVILKISVIGKVNKYSLDLDHFILDGKNNNYVPSQKFYLYFNDIGIGYRNNILDTTSYKDYILVFNINNIDKDSNFIFRYVDNDRGVKISPEVIY